jgi:uncharacterized membrane protein YhaH (DUF805 family)
MDIFLNTLMKKYADFNGRARRKEYWTFVLFNVLIALIGYLIAGLGASMESSAMSMFGMLFLILTGIGLLIPNIAVAVRRMHDTNRSGWSLLLSLIPLVGAIILLVYTLSEGNRGPNQYGPDPKNPSELNEIGTKDFV